MSGIKSPSPKAQATDVIVVSHGQPSEPGPPETDLAELTAKIAQHLPGWTLHSATLAAEGALDRALDACATPPLIYPLFMTDGWFTQSLLPKRLNGREARILAPFGSEPALPALARDILQETLDAQGWQADETCLLVAAHGSGRSRNSARATQSFADALAGLIQFRDLRLGFIEEPPYLGDVAFDTGDKAICLPFFAAKLGHVTDDIPEALDLADFAGPRLEPIGTDARAPALIAAALTAAMSNAPAS